VASKRALTARERGFVMTGVAVALVLVVVIVAAVSTSSPTSGHGCVYVTITSSTGALTLQGCGARARRICADVHVPGAYSGGTLVQVIDECRKAGVSTRRLA
jgi:hypothetical protein